ncbi:type IV toxin-antitoxin system AbiEi family antitoxin domain-containing protein [Mycobacterium hubeiense]|uniref:type IV toxin-antitoxin system AbiEi family antitoxin domain-containing protein n=1 Tax=Mycobacterium hubeiense TaxID=1867256 RepID=UPI000C7ECAEB|nr:type IV toxin-antitoxin system AbiEi family antitoxin domain-containing protein [Mycobacterium sp. QGD 101]
MVRSERYLELADIAAGQWGMLTTAQAGQAGVNAQQIARLTRSGVLHRLQHGIYRLAGVPHDPLAELKAAWLGLEPDTLAADRLTRTDPGGVVSHRSAAKVHHLGDLDADYSEFPLTTARRTRHRDIRLHKRALTPEDWQIVDGLPTTTVPTTIADLAAADTDGGHLGHVLRAAILHGQITTHAAATTLRPYAHNYGAPLGDGHALLRALLAQAGLTQTINAATELGTEWLAEQLDQTGRRYRAADIMMAAGRQMAVDEELLGHSGIFGFAPPDRRRPPSADGDAGR